ncbi:hypothetical protein FDO65_06815 [Nakamurella flava]|uniref:Uncharacterized protein n=1 Tax=Nakamurella flava TaxID=2576308 RepID=A0A4U6QLX3_9ACTN|nr:hypothetical protein [Nakamurella flava]TKV61309.1 hypothetical protein FDO65_06815 [Nakamurella flava]
MTGVAGSTRHRWARRAMVGAVLAVVVGLVTAAAVLKVVGRSTDSLSELASGAACEDGPAPRPLPVPTASSEAVVAFAVGASYWNPSALGQNLSMTAYRDGTVLNASGIGGFPGGEVELTLGWVGPCAVASADEHLSALTGVDFGLPGVADASTALVMVNPNTAGRRTVLQVYAFDQSDVWPENEDALSARATVQEVVRGLQAATDRVPWTSDRFRAQWSDGFTRMVGPEVTSWPLTTSIIGLRGPNGCAELPRATAERLIHAQPGGELVAQWTDGEKSTVVALSVLMPGELACPPRSTPWR